MFFASPGSLTTLARKAPDFFDWNSGVYEPSVPHATEQPHIETASRDHGEFTNLPVEQKRTELERLTRLAEQYRDDSPAARRALGEILLRLGQLHTSMGEYPAARLALEQAVVLLTPLEARTAAAEAWYELASLDINQGELDRALGILQESLLPIYTEIGDLRGRAVTLGRVADILQARGRLDEALRILTDEVLPTFERVGDVHARAVTLGKVAEILQARGQLDEALRIRQEEELPVYERLGDVRARAVGRANLARNLLARGLPGDREQAAGFLRAALADADAMAIPDARTIREILASIEQDNS